MKADLDEINHLLTRYDVGSYQERAPWIYEAIALMVNHPCYEGDIEYFD